MVRRTWRGVSQSRRRANGFRGSEGCLSGYIGLLHVVPGTQRDKMLMMARADDTSIIR